MNAVGGKNMFLKPPRDGQKPGKVQRSKPNDEIKRKKAKRDYEDGGQRKFQTAWKNEFAWL